MPRPIVQQEYTLRFKVEQPLADMLLAEARRMHKEPRDRVKELLWAHFEATSEAQKEPVSSETSLS